jgi:hypothetical protein
MRHSVFIVLSIGRLNVTPARDSRLYHAEAGRVTLMAPARPVKAAAEEDFLCALA